MMIIFIYLYIIFELILVFKIMSLFIIYTHFHDFVKYYQVLYVAKNKKVVKSIRM